MLKFNLQMIGLGFLVFVFGAMGLGSFQFGQLPGHYVIGAVALLLALGSLILLVRLRKRRSEWMRTVGRYESYGVFEAELREAAGVREDLKAYILGKLAEPIQGVTGGAISTVRELLERDSLGTAYAKLQAQRRDASMTESQFREAIDALFEVCRPRRR